MKNGLVVLLSLLILACGGTKLEQSTTLNPTNNPKGVKGEVVQSEAPANDNDSSKAVNAKIKAFTTVADIEEIMVFLTSDELQGRDTGSEGIAEAAEFIQDIFKKNQIEPYFSSYRDTLTNFEKGTAFNMVGYLPGTDTQLKNEFIIIGAHYDHIGLQNEENGDAIANGANDNASGTTAVLEFAKYFGSLKENKRSIIFALFSAEEKGLLGSKHLAQKLKDSNIDVYAMLNFEMIGVPMVDKDHSLYLTGYQLSNLAEITNAYAHKNLVGFLPKAKEFNLFRRSDNAPFHDLFNVPSQTYSSFDFTNFDYYHKVGDEASKMDFIFMSTIVNEMIPVLSGIVNSSTKEIKYN
ncbi:MAG: M20/M25/M40 family metallo-hydrolase [Maribacter sp.]